MNKKTISIENIDHITYITILERRIFLGITDQFRDELIKEVDRGIEFLILDLSNVSVMNSAGLGVLLQVRDKMIKRSHQLVLVGLHSVMQDIFSRMKLESFYTIYKTKEEAIRYLQTEIKKAYKLRNQKREEPR